MGVEILLRADRDSGVQHHITIKQKTILQSFQGSSQCLLVFMPHESIQQLSYTGHPIIKCFFASAWPTSKRSPQKKQAEKAPMDLLSAC